jgi:hypothetical protein
MLCAHALYFVLYAPCSCFVLIGFFGHRLPSTNHAHGADGQQQQADAPAHKNRVFLSRTAKHKAQSMSTKQPIMTKRCDFELKARSTKHEHKAATKKLGSVVKQGVSNSSRLYIIKTPFISHSSATTNSFLAMPLSISPMVADRACSVLSPFRKPNWSLCIGFVFQVVSSRCMLTTFSNPL